ncbi:MAG TPA: YaiI/YqxD family protein [Syntrophomonas sp.]|nr:YaiI/YqxD family protein [Syntrophomonas sp.]HRW12768.1 YaiI/YqxD family protein [Syntrophomonas sp.]
MKIIVDADACPVKKIIEKTAAKYHLEVIMVSNYHHQIDSTYATVMIADGQSQAADVMIANQTRAGDIVVTQDYGLAAIILGRHAYALHPQGHRFTDANIEGLLMKRYENQKARQAGKRIAGPRKRTQQDDQHFAQQLEELIQALR